MASGEPATASGHDNSRLIDLEGQSGNSEIERFVIKDGYVLKGTDGMLQNPYFGGGTGGSPDASADKLITALAQFALPAVGPTLTAADYNNRIQAVCAANVI
ncbi:hypothetical protein [Propionivibrio dicarboxylicus]|uniref:Uncharacterized protein n=1 Tax=Propionivibrio dicarboxylicus TaxID=83767 RepID=A0A1G8BMJ1_9RHOO|nr:hypothetical protein [Propionivibrio dicarboxylicus]SDH34381.1 hypothetical protein SAMN05660652_01548 [Propionivibrio dicarboxylicus]